MDSLFHGIFRDRAWCPVYTDDLMGNATNAISYFESLKFILFSCSAGMERIFCM